MIDKDSEVFLNEHKLDYLLNLVKQIENQLPFLIELPIEKRKQIYRKGKNQLEYMRKVYSYANKYPFQELPYIDVKLMINYLDVADRLKTLKKSLDEITQSLDDTAISLYQESYNSAKILYKNYQISAMNKIPGTKEIIEDLRKHFPRTGKLKNIKD